MSITLYEPLYEKQMNIIFLIIEKWFILKSINSL